MAVAFVKPSFDKQSSRFSKLTDKSNKLSLSLELESPLSVLSALVSLDFDALFFRPPAIGLLSWVP